MCLRSSESARLYQREKNVGEKWPLLPLVCMWSLQKALPLNELLPCLLFISQQMFPILHKWRYYDARARHRIG